MGTLRDTTDMFARLKIGNNNNTRGDDFKKIKTLGSGVFGCVDLSEVVVKKSYAKKGDQVAIKRFVDISDQDMAKKEALLLKKLVHWAIVRYLDVYKNAKGRLCLVMEYCNSGTLEDYLAWRKQPLPEYEMWRLVWQFSSVLSFLHSQHPPILHNDLKPANILCKVDKVEGRIGKKMTIKIADFGVCNVLGRFKFVIISKVQILFRQDPLRHVLLRLPSWGHNLLSGARGPQRRSPRLYRR